MFFVLSYSGKDNPHLCLWWGKKVKSSVNGGVVHCHIWFLQVTVSSVISNGQRGWSSAACNMSIALSQQCRLPQGCPGICAKLDLSSPAYSILSLPLVSRYHQTNKIIKGMYQEWYVWYQKLGVWQLPSLRWYRPCGLLHLLQSDLCSSALWCVWCLVLCVCVCCSFISPPSRTSIYFLKCSFDFNECCPPGWIHSTNTRKKHKPINMNHVFFCTNRPSFSQPPGIPRYLRHSVRCRMMQCPWRERFAASPRPSGCSAANARTFPFCATLGTLGYLVND